MKHPTPLSQEVEFINEAMGAYDIQGQLEVQRIPTGYSNSVYRVDQNDFEVSYAVHLPTNFRAQVLENEIVIHESLKKSVITSPPILYTKNRLPYYTREGQTAVVSPWMKGRHPESGNIPTSACRTLGQSLATFHRSVTELPHINDSQLWKEDIVAWGSENEIVDITAAKNLWGIAQELGVKALERGIVHGDFHANNVLVDNNCITVLDMERVGESVLLFDIARAAIDLCSTREKFSFEKANAFLDGYAQVRPLTQTERSLYRPALAYAALVVAGWFYANGNEGMTTHFLNIGNSAMAQR